MTRARMLGTAVAGVSLALAFGCSHQGETGQGSRLSPEQAEAIARARLRQEGFDAERYRSLPSLDTNQSQWVFVFQLNVELRPPGSDLVVRVSGSDGKTQFIRGQ